MQLDAHLATEVYPDNGKALIHMAAAAGALSTVEVCMYVCMQECSYAMNTVCYIHIISENI